MKYITQTILLGADEKICDFSIDNFVLEKIEIKDINYRDDFWDYYGKHYSQKMFPYKSSLTNGKYYIMLTHITDSNTESITDETFNYYLSKVEFKAFPYKNKKPCINVLEYIDKIRLYTGANIYPTHIMTYKYVNNIQKELEFVYEFKIPSSRILNDTFKFPTPQEKYEEFIIKSSMFGVPNTNDKCTFAFELYRDSLYQTDIKMEYLMLTISLEALYNDDRYKYNLIASNYAKFLSYSEEQQKHLEKKINLFYWVRNQLVHAGKWDETYQLSNTADLREAVRIGIVKYMEEVYGLMSHIEFLDELNEI